ncbi:GFA family protein [Paraburkholderia phosphatilytica]|uniref:GFA family protein n=1 Tax=Paraburkholderia phosphatilytica TaxID=2282883 RepID=UPI000E4A8678|nr:GFA family protein [Paraburkholderia phosphatilytica]
MTSTGTGSNPHSDVVQEGGCACGAVRFRVSAPPKRVGMCHCMTCRRVSGAPFALFVIFHGKDVTVQGRTEAWRSSETGRRHFCPVCGSVAFLDGLDTDEVELPLGAFDRTGIYEPQYELWVKRREPWLPHGVRPEYEGDRPV